MPQVFKIGSYWVYFWANESKPLEPIHVHISKGKPNANATKFWITKTGKCLLASKRQTATNDASKIDAKVNHFNLTQSAKIVAAQKAPTECPDGNDVLLLMSSGRGS